MTSSLPDYLITLLAQSTAAHGKEAFYATAAHGKEAFYDGARKHPDWTPFLIRVARDRLRRWRLKPVYEIEDLVSRGATHIVNQAWILIEEPSRPRGGLRLDPNRKESWNWGVLVTTASQGMRRDHSVRKHIEGSELAEVQDTILIETEDLMDRAILVVLVDRRWVRPLKRSLCLRDELIILEVGRQLGLHPSEVVAGTINRLHRKLSTSESIDRSWAKRVMSYVDRPWTF